MMPFGQDYNTRQCIKCGNLYWAEYYKLETPCPACQRVEREKQFQQTINNQPLNQPSSFYFQSLIQEIPDQFRGYFQD